MNNFSKIDQYKTIYKSNLKYQRNLLPMYKTINSCINFDLQSFLDYGCGRSNLCEIMKINKKIKTYKYDPAIPEFNYIKKGLKVDLIANCDVMEHIPESEVDVLLEHMSNISQNVFFNIYLKKATTYLPNGENAHCTIKPIYWWRKKIKKYFNTTTIVPTTYKNSVTIITWNISIINLLKVYLNNFNIFSQYLLWLIRVNFFKKK